jgi:hypothetical protein
VVKVNTPPSTDDRCHSATTLAHQARHSPAFPSSLSNQDAREHARGTPPPCQVHPHSPPTTAACPFSPAHGCKLATSHALTSLPGARHFQGPGEVSLVSPPNTMLTHGVTLPFLQSSERCKANRQPLLYLCSHPCKGWTPCLCWHSTQSAPCALCNVYPWYAFFCLLPESFLTCNPLHTTLVHDRPRVLLTATCRHQARMTCAQCSALCRVYNAHMMPAPEDDARPVRAPGDNARTMPAPEDNACPAHVPNSPG